MGKKRLGVLGEKGECNSEDWGIKEYLIAHQMVVESIRTNKYRHLVP